MVIRSEDAEKWLGSPKKADPILRAKVLKEHPLGSHREYEQLRAGVVVDVSLCGQWVLLKRDRVRPNEREKIAVLERFLRKI